MLSFELRKVINCQSARLFQRWNSQVFVRCCISKTWEAGWRVACTLGPHCDCCALVRCAHATSHPPLVVLGLTLSWRKTRFYLLIPRPFQNTTVEVRGSSHCCILGQIANIAEGFSWNLNFPHILTWTHRKVDVLSLSVSIVQYFLLHLLHNVTLDSAISTHGCFKFWMVWIKMF